MSGQNRITRNGRKRTGGDIENRNKESVQIKRAKTAMEPPANHNNGCVNNRNLRRKNFGTARVVAVPTSAHAMRLRNRFVPAGPSGRNIVTRRAKVKLHAPMPEPQNGRVPNDGDRQENNWSFVDLTLDATLEIINETEPAADNYNKLLQLEEANGVIPNFEEFDCAICFTSVDEREGVMLRNCLHTFCRECIGQLIVVNEPCDVKCPFIQGDEICNEVLQDREIRELLTKEQYEDYLVKSLRSAENTAPDAFHCRTPNCTGWTFHDRRVTKFECPVCRASNCISCKAVHKKSCAEYQTQKNKEHDAKKTQEALDAMIAAGDGMHCPSCTAFITKPDGCDLVKCIVCKLAICWATKQRRWGPGGRGDNSQGCQCKVGGKLCHPNCRNCH